MDWDQEIKGLVKYRNFADTLLGIIRQIIRKNEQEKFTLDDFIEQIIRVMKNRELFLEEWNKYCLKLIGENNKACPDCGRSPMREIYVCNPLRIVGYQCLYCGFRIE